MQGSCSGSGCNDQSGGGAAWEEEPLVLVCCADTLDFVFLSVVGRMKRSSRDREGYSAFLFT